MKLQQLRCIVAMVRNKLNVSETAQYLHTSQPGVSKQIRQLEDELGVELFERSGRQIVSITPAGRDIIGVAESILTGVDNIRSLGKQHADPNSGELRLATTHTQARYVLPAIIEEFDRRFPRVAIHIHQGTPEQMATMVESGDVDLVIATEGHHHFDDLVLLPCYRWNRAVVVPEKHSLYKLNQLGGLTLEALAEFSLITYVFGFSGRSQFDQAFRSRDLEPDVVLTAADTDVIKTYVRAGRGVGIIARIAYQQELDADLCLLDASQLFPSSITYIGMRKHRQLRPFMYAFIKQFASHLDESRVDAALAAGSARERERIFADIDLPEY